MEVASGFGEFFKKKRRDLGLTLREFCRLNGFDPGNISKIKEGSSLRHNLGRRDWIMPRH